MVLTSIKFYTEGKILIVEVDLINQVNSFIFTYLVLLDWISLLFISVVALISSVVMLYRFSYISIDVNKNRFYILVFIFVLSMFLIVMSPQMLSILLGWDGLGLVSYCLVIYYRNYKSQNAGIVTFLSNRIGDLGIIITIRWLINYGSINLINMQYIYSYNSVYLFCIVIIAAITKRAQIPFSAWLPAAIAAPTPVSSLVHSSTLVTAGVYLLIRFNYLIKINYYLLIFSCLTIIISGIRALFENDIKKVIALSTLRQLGVIIFALSIGIKELAFFHLLRHALFKSLLFLCAGFYIHSNFDWQDIRRFNMLHKNFPSVRIYFRIASLALRGFPFLSGFYSKDAVIEVFLINNQNLLVFLILIIATCLTLVYRIRLIYLTFFIKITLTPPFLSSFEDFIIIAPILILFMLSIIGGRLISWIYFPWVFISLRKLVKLIVLTLLTLVFILRRMFKKILIFFSNKIIFFISLIWLIPIMTLNMIIFYIHKRINYIKLMDQGWLELIGGQGVYTLFSRYSNKIDLTHLANMKNLLFVILLIIIFFLII